MRDKCKSGIFRNLDHALDLFDEMLHMDPLPSIVDFTGLLAAIAIMKHYLVVITLFMGLCLQGKINGAMRLVDEMEKKGYEPDRFTCGTIVNGLCKIGETNVAISLLWKMEKGNFLLDPAAYNTIIDSLCKDRLVIDALKLLSEMISEGIKPDHVTSNCLIQGVCNFGQWRDATTLLNDSKRH